MTLTESIRFSDGQIDPDAHAVGTVNGAWVGVADFGEIAALLAIGAMGSGATISCKLQQAQSAAGAGSKDISGAELSKSESAGDGQETVAIEIAPSALDSANGFDHVRLSCAVGGAAVDFGALLLRALPGRSPVDNG